MKFNRTDKERYGCDYCKETPSTEKFEGYCGSLLWICNKCYKILIKSPKKKMTNYYTTTENMIKMIYDNGKRLGLENYEIQDILMKLERDKELKNNKN